MADNTLTDDEMAVIVRHMGQNVHCCSTDGLTCRDYFFGCVASECLNGLLMQLHQKGTVGDGTTEPCCTRLYCEACYPCVITDYCCLVTLCADSDEIRALIYADNRSKLLKDAGSTTPFSNSFAQQYCPLCYCTPCHNAAILRGLTPIGYGSFWCGLPGSR